jgi:hypothetical protein
MLDTVPEVYDTMVVDTFFRWWYCRSWGQGSQGDSCLIWDSYSIPDSIPPPDDTTTADYKDIDSLAWTIWNDTTTTLDNGELRVVEIVCICGDASNDGAVNISDGVFLVNYIFNGGPAPVYPECADVDNSTTINISDVVYLINYIFKQGPEPNCGF